MRTSVLGPHREIQDPSHGFLNSEPVSHPIVMKRESVKMIGTTCFVEGDILLYLNVVILERNDWWLGCGGNRTYQS